MFVLINRILRIAAITPIDNVIARLNTLEFKQCMVTNNEKLYKQNLKRVFLKDTCCKILLYFQGQSGAATAFINRTKAVKRLQLSLKDFRYIYATVVTFLSE